MTRVVMVRHAEPLVDAGMPAAEWPLTDQGRENAEALGRRTADGSAPRSCGRAPNARPATRRRVPFLQPPSASARSSPRSRSRGTPRPVSWRTPSRPISRGDVVEGWEPRADVIARFARLTPVEADLRASERAVVVSHGVLIATWLDHAIGLEDPYSFWSNLRTPDAWEFDLGEVSLRRITQRRRAGVAVAGPMTRRRGRGEGGIPSKNYAHDCLQRENLRPEVALRAFDPPGYGGSGGIRAASCREDSTYCR